jgi:hypothetical protein
MITEMLELVYYAYVQSIMSYGIILGGIQCTAKKVFYIQKRIIRIMAGAEESLMYGII